MLDDDVLGSPGGGSTCQNIDHGRPITVESKAPAEPAVDKKRQQERARVIRARGHEFVQHHPMAVENVLDHWHTGTADERRQGLNWYSDARATCEVLAEDTGLTQYQLAGLVAVYSAQTFWASAIITAAMVAKSRTPLGGAGSGVPATKHMKNQAQRILSGGLYDDVLRGYKTNTFAYLTFHGGDNPEDKAAGCRQVCIDKHTYSVACGPRAADAAYAAAGPHSRIHYQEAADCYRRAADFLSNSQGFYIAPHQVQATVWIVRRRINQSQGQDSKGRAERALERMRRYLIENHPRAALLVPGSG